jgi:hypothetical protein
MTAAEKRSAYSRAEATRQLRAKEYDLIRKARFQIVSATCDINDALRRLEYLENDRKGETK